MLCLTIQAGDANICFDGKLELKFEITVAIATIFSYEITALLGVTCTHLSGKIHFSCRAPPSDRVWFGFYEEPKVKLTIDPTIGSTNVAGFPKLTKIIVNKIKQELVEMLVMPEMDDLPIPKFKAPNGEAKEATVAFEFARKKHTDR